MQRHILAIVCILAILLAVAPVCLHLLFGYSIDLSILVPLFVIGWVLVAVVMISQRQMLLAVDSAAQHLGFTSSAGGLEEKLERFLTELGRYHRASYAYKHDEQSKAVDIGANLKRIAELAYEELPARAVELALFDASSGLWTQSMIIGDPASINSQSMLTDQDGIGSDKGVLVQPVSFAGTLFGTIRVELEEGVEPSLEDRQVLYLLARQGGLMLVDARFTDVLLRMKRAGEESTRAKTGFLANLSHEIRGPLGIILNGVELIKDGLCGPVSESQQETLNMIKQNGDHLLDLVNDVLDYAKAEAGKVTAKPVEIPLADILSDLANVVRSQTILKKQSLTVEPVPKDLGMLCDKRHARQMLINFLTNAVKYTLEGGSITVGAERIAGNRVKIWIKDNGIGIAESEQSKVFGAFERVNDRYALSQTGTGLGMPLTKVLAELNDGTVNFESTLGAGSTFWLILPAAEIKEHQTSIDDLDATVEQKGQGAGETVLLVDHDHVARSMLERYLVHQGYKVFGATNGADVMRLIRDEGVELAIVENEMPDLSGEEIISVIRGNPKGINMPIVLLSAKAFVFDIERFLRLGVDRCLSKPVELGELATTIRRLIDEARKMSHPTDTGSLPT